MTKLATLGAASLLALAGAAAMAQTPPAAPATPPGAASPPGAPAPTEGARPRRGNAADLRAVVDARLAGVPAGLKLTPEQQRLWLPVEQGLRAQANERIERIDARRSSAQPAQAPQPQDLMQRLEQRSQQVTERAQRLQSFASAMKPFWDSLNEDQKRVLPVLIRPTPIAQLGFGREDDDHDGRSWRERRDRRGMMMMMEHHRSHHGGRGGDHHGPGDRR